MSRSEYSLEQFGRMIEDKIRTDACCAAIARSVRPNHAVVDLGCGPGVFGLLACKAGARRVYAFDMSGVWTLAASSQPPTVSLSELFSCVVTHARYIFPNASISSFPMCTVSCLFTP